MPSSATSTLTANIVELLGPLDLNIQSQTLDLSKLEPNQVAAKTLFSAISPGTEVAAYRGDPPLRPGKVYPRVVGYCNVAEIVEKGNSVSRYDIGDKILTFQSHRSAFICNQSEIITRIPEGADLVEASTTYLFHLGYDALLKSGFFPGHTVAVVGLGTLGVTTALLAQASGGRVVGFSNQSASRDLLKGTQIETYNKDEGASVYENEFGPALHAGADIVINTSNHWEDLRLSMQLARKGGKICLMGFPGRNQPIPPFNPLDSQHFYDKQLTLLACGHTTDLDVAPYDIRFTIARNCAFLMESIVAKRVDATRIISGVLPWQEITSAYEQLMNRTSSMLTYVMRW